MVARDQRQIQKTRYVQARLKAREKVYPLDPFSPPDILWGKGARRI
jgi:hypothetical protein